MSASDSVGVDAVLVVYDEDADYLAVTLDVLPQLGVLVSGVRGVTKLPAATAAALRHAGLLGADGEVEPLLAAVAEVIDRALVEVDVELATSGGLVTALAVVSVVGALIAFPAAARADEPHKPAGADDARLAELVLTPALEVPFKLGELLDVTARPHTDHPSILLPDGLIDELLATPPEEAAVSLSEILGASDAVPAGVVEALQDVLHYGRAHWSVTSRVAISDREVVERCYEAIDAGAAGWWFVVRDGGKALLEPTTGRHLVEALESLLPTEEDLRSFAGDLEQPDPGPATATASWPIGASARTDTASDRAVWSTGCGSAPA